MANKITYSKNDVIIVNALKGAEDGLTLAAINEIAGLKGTPDEIVPGHINGTVRKGLVETIGETEVYKPTNRPVIVYHFETAEVLKDAKGKDFNYSNDAVNILAAAKDLVDFTLAELATALGKEKMSSGSVNHLVKKGNLSKLEEKRNVITMVKTPVNVYGFVKDIPADAEIR